MDRVQGQHENVLRTAVAHYIEDLCGDKPIWLGGSWGTYVHNYVRNVWRIIKNNCSVCQLAENVCNLVIEIPYDRINDFNYVRWSVHQSVPHDIPAAAMQCLDNNNPNIRAVWVFVSTIWELPNGEIDGHAGFMVFDKLRKKQIVFDPSWSHDIDDRTTMVVSKALCEYQFHPQYDLVPVNRCGWNHNELSLQSGVEDIMHMDEQGLCGLLSLLVILCCIRFNYYNPLHLATILRDVLSNQQQLYGNKLISWYDDLVGTPDNQVLSALYPERRNNGLGLCYVYSRTTNTLCKRKACKEGQQKCLCWQHKFLNSNKPSGNKKCNAPQTQCPQ